MSIQPLQIDNIAFAKRGEHLIGDLSLAHCPRLAELLASQLPILQNDAIDTNALTSVNTTENSIHFTLDGETNAMGQHFLHLSLVSNLTTYCQRCLEPMLVKQSLSFHYQIIDVNAKHSELDVVEDSDDFDMQEANQAMDLVALIEDEIIMATPIAPTHAHDCAVASMQSGEKPNPFAVLKGLIKS
ncbi:MAG: YceD family protein [Methylotenera sp.]